MRQILFVIPWSVLVPYFYALLGIAVLALIIIWRITKNAVFLNGIVVAAVALFVVWLVSARFHVENIPVYGYGMMLFFAFIGCSWLARRLCRREGIDGSIIPDLAIWLFVSGIIGGRLGFVIWYWHSFDGRPLDVFKLWDGGLVLYGALFGGAVGYCAFYLRYLKKQAVSNWKMLDIIAPCVALGIAFGRIGCLLTGCCYGNVACSTCGIVPIHFPQYANNGRPHKYTPPSDDMIRRGYQTANGFILEGLSLKVQAVEPGSPAANAGLKAGDVILRANGKEAVRQSDIEPGDNGLKLTVLRGDAEIPLPPFTPTSIGLTPTQPFETISMCLLLFFMLSYYPYKRRDGELMVILLVVYAVHRYLNEMLRLDIDAGAFGLTLSQLISIGIFAAGVILALMVRRRPLIGAAPKEPAPTGIVAMT